MAAGYTGPEDFSGPDGFLKDLIAAVMNRAMETEMAIEAVLAEPWFGRQP